ncbi:MAG: NAD-dependent epimerase/dehydratase family protein [Pseudomonadota bacterium]
MTNTKTSIVLGAGPLGRAIAENLAAKGEPVVVVTRDGRQIGAGIEVRNADLSSAGETTNACDGASVIYQCAAPPYHQWQDKFPALQKAAIEAAARTGAALVAVENLYGYGVAGRLAQDAPLSATTRKGRVRASMSEALLDAHKTGKVTCVAGRATDFFGPGVTMSALGERFWPAVLNGKPVDWVGDPNALHSFAFLPDLAAAYIALAEDEGMWGKAWHMPALPPISARNLCALIANVDGSDTRIRRTPSWLLRVVGMFQPAAKELIEMRYMFDEPFIVDHAPFNRHVPDVEVSTWEDAISKSVIWWQSQ